jgi:hypothetical protein
MFCKRDPQPPPYTLISFYTSTFSDGSSPQISPAPCWIIEGFSPACLTPWPALWALVPPHFSHVNLNSQKVGQVATVGCSSGLRVVANEINAQCNGTWETAHSKVSDPFFNFSYYVFDVGIGADYGIELDYPSFDDFGPYTGGERRAKANFKTTIPGNLYWTYYVRCTRNGKEHQQLVNKPPQHIKCP